MLLVAVVLALPQLLLAHNTTTLAYSSLFNATKANSELCGPTLTGEDKAKRGALQYQ